MRPLPPDLEVELSPEARRMIAKMVSGEEPIEPTEALDELNIMYGEDGERDLCFM